MLDQQEVLIYLNGTLHSTHTGNPEFPIIYSDGSFWLGMIGFETCPNLALDDIGIWNRALTAAEIAQVYSGSASLVTYYLDSDGDGFGDPNFSVESSTGAPAGYALDNTDCHDSNANVYPEAPCDDGDALTMNDAYTGECVCVGSFCPSLEPALQTGLVGYWPFCGNANDESGNGNNGVVNGATLTEDRFGNANQCYQFNLNDITVPIGNEQFASDFTISTWVRVDSYSELTNNYPTFIWEENAGLVMQAEASNSSTRYNCYFLDQYGIGGSQVEDGHVQAESNISEWNHVVLSSQNGINSLYVNGVIAGVADFASTLQGVQAGSFLKFGNGGEFSSEDFFGSLDDIGIWNRALTAEEVVLLYGDFTLPMATFYLDSDGDGYGDPNFTVESNTGAPAGYVTDNTDCQDSNANVYPGATCDDGNSSTLNDAYTGDCLCVGTICPFLEVSLQNGLVGYWPFCGNANDESGNGNDGVVNGATLTEDRFGNTGSAYEFNNSITVDTSFILLPITNDFMQADFTLSVWSKLNAWSSSYPVIAEGDNATFELGYSMSTGNPLIYFYYEEFLESGSSFGDVNAPSDWSHWQHTVVINNNQQTFLYINGELVSTSNALTIAQAQQVSDFFRLGKGFVSDLNAFDGIIDDAGFWNRALTVEEVALLYGNSTQLVAGCTDPLAFNYNPQATVNEGCQYIATILVYNDLNGNGAHEADELGLTNWPVLGNDINGLVWTNGNGNAFLPLETGSYEFTVLNTTDNWLSTSPTSVTIDLTGGPATASFGLQVIPGEAIVAAGPFTGFWDILHCTEGYESGVYIENIGSQTVSGFMTLTCDPLFTPDADSYFTTPPAEVGPGYALWNVEDFLPGEYELLSFHIDGPGVEYLNQSFTFAFDLTLFDPQGNMIYSDNWSVSPIVACAYDPNDITGFPEGLSAPHEEGYTIEHYILPDNMVEFRVRFQNTGTLPAEDIDIYIPIDPNQWELNTIFPLMRSAEMQVICLHDDGLNLSLLEHELPEGITAEDLLVFSFDDIYLPNSASNPDGSQGYVYFRMRAKHTLNIGDEINAQAFIYFEQNPAVVTNETYHVIFDCTSFTPMVGDIELCAGEALQFSASQPNVDDYAWNIGSLEGSGNIFLFEGIDAGEYTLELNTSNMLCPQGEDHQVNVIVHDIPQLDVPLDATVCEGEELTYSAESDGAITWSNGANTGDTFAAEQSFSVTATAEGAGG